MLSQRNVGRQNTPRQNLSRQNLPIEMSTEGHLIALEGVDEELLDAASQKLYRWLRERGIAAERTAEPTGGPVGAQIRLWQSGRLSVDPVSLALYDLADRMDHLCRADGILAWLEAGRTVLCTHYLLASFARHSCHVGLDWLEKINARCRPPDLTLFLDTWPHTAAHIAPQYAAMVEILQSKGQHIVTVAGSVEDVNRLCQQHIARLLGCEAEE